MQSGFGVEHELAKRDYSRAAERWRARERRANAVENTGQAVAGTSGTLIGAAALRDAAINDHPNVETKLASAGAKIGPRTAAVLTHGKPGLKVLAGAVGGTIVAGVGGKSRKAAAKRARRLEEMSKAAEPGAQMHAADLAKAFSVNRAGEAVRVFPKAARKRSAIRVNSSGEALPVRTKVDAPGPQRKPFLHPKARAQKDPARNGALINEASSGAPLKDQVRRASAVGGPKAPKKVLDALSGPDYETSLGRVGRAIRRQDKEFSAQIHPISGRVTDMRRGGPASTMMGVPRTERKSTKRLAELADRTKNPKVKERATATVARQNPNTKGPDPVYVHNHPTFKDGDKAHTRHYPSAPDLTSAAQTGSRQVVISHKPGPRGSKQTKAVTSRAIKPNAAHTLRSVGEHDVASMTPGLMRHAAAGNKGQLKDLEGMRDAARGGRKKVTPYDKYVKAKTGSKKAAEKSGFHTRETMHKGMVAPNDASIKRHKKAQQVVGGTAATLGLGALATKSGAKILPKMKFGKTPRGNAWAQHLDSTANALVYGASGVGGASGLHQASIYGAESRKRKPPTA